MHGYWSLSPASTHTKQKLQNSQQCSIIFTILAPNTWLIHKHNSPLIACYKTMIHTVASIPQKLVNIFHNKYSPSMPFQLLFLPTWSETIFLCPRANNQQQVKTATNGTVQLWALKLNYYHWSKDAIYSSSVHHVCSVEILCIRDGGVWVGVGVYGMFFSR